MPTTTTPEPTTGQLHELGRYEIDEGTRIVAGQRVDGVVHVTDRPLGRPGRPYLVETAISSWAELAALVADYRRQAEWLGDCPMRASVIEVDESSRLIEALS